MDWIQSMQKAVNFIEDNILDDLSNEQIAENVYSSNANFQRIFSIITGMTIGDYIRNRRLTLAGEELLASDDKVVNIAMKYGYETAESFTKAFLRFHGVLPSAVKAPGNSLKYFAPLSIQVDIRGGFNMTRKLIPGVPAIDYDGNNAAFIIDLLEAAFTGAGEKHDKAQLSAYSGESNGWKAKYITIQRDKDGNPLNTDVEQIRQDFVDAINSGLPVLARYAISPDVDYNVFFGYEDDGLKIISRDNIPNQVTEPNARINWENNIADYILLREKTELAPERERALGLFRMIVSHARRTDEIRGRKIGFAAWESFLYHLENDDFSTLALRASDVTPSGCDANNVEQRFIIYCDALCQIYARKEALPYYLSLAERFPEWQKELQTAVNALDACASYGGFLWSQGLSFDEAGYEKFRMNEVRKILADAGRVAMLKDMEAVEQFEMILHNEGISASSPQQLERDLLK